MKRHRANIRAAKFGDALDIFRLIKQYPAELLARPIGDIVQNIDRSLVCEVGGRVVGTVSWQILPEMGMPRSPSVEIRSLAVARKHRRTGFGHALVREAIRRVRRMHPTQIIALTFTPSFFAKLGFVPVPKEHLMHKIYMGCINCSKYDSPFTCPEQAMALKIRGRPG